MVNTAHSALTGTSLHEAKREKAPVRVASTANITLSAPGTTIDGVTMAAGESFLAKNQTASTENGPYVWNGAAIAATRRSDAAVAADFVQGFKVYVSEGSVGAASIWMFTQSAAVTIGSTALTFAKVNAGAGTVTSVALSVPAEFSVAGSPVTTAGTLAISKASQTGNLAFASPNGSSGVPTFRALLEADITNLVADLAAKAGLASPTFTGTISTPGLAVSGLTGSVAASRYVGATASGAPSTGPHVEGDFSVDQTGKMWVCTVAGTPGTFVQVGAGGTATVTVEELDAAPSVAASVIKFPNGTLTDNGSGSVTYTPSGAATPASAGANLYLAATCT